MPDLPSFPKKFRDFHNKRRELSKSKVSGETDIFFDQWLIASCIEVINKRRRQNYKMSFFVSLSWINKNKKRSLNEIVHQ